MRISDWSSDVCSSDLRPVWLECRLLESGVARAAVDNVGSRRVHVLVVGSGTWPLSVTVGRIIWADGEARQANLGGDGRTSGCSDRKEKERRASRAAQKPARCGCQ